MQPFELNDHQFNHPYPSIETTILRSLTINRWLHPTDLLQALARRHLAKKRVAKLRATQMRVREALGDEVNGWSMMAWEWLMMASNG